MSLFLGKIHYWVFNKILWFENLEENIIEIVSKDGIDVKNIRSKIENKYGKKLENKNLEEIIDLENIHDWLQNKFHSSEARLAVWIKIVLENNPDIKIKLEKIFKEQGTLTAKEAKVERKYNTASDIYDSINNYILDGMPCDKVNIISISEENLVKWKRSACIHEEIWTKVGLDVEIFYNLRNIWIENFVKELNSNFKYLEESPGEYKISKKIKIRS
ncbi:hypothetical protein [uncultured Fusobacterium sp.]|jgi:hypothetical protein|uniref:hypothetical protein n=1 Tax=uncultured Fusobacterium sp. TaxID=159267 RepID=UPI0025CD6D54|nr:hypothetical protein [uncultured Fusobacterium sp.]